MYQISTEVATLFSQYLEYQQTRIVFLIFIAIRIPRFGI